MAKMNPFLYHPSNKPPEFLPSEKRIPSIKSTNGLVHGGYFIDSIQRIPSEN
jgi:hypothetical protein